MVFKIYLLILIYFILGLISGKLISRGKNETFRNEFWLKFRYYFIIFNVVFSSIVFNPVYFHYLSFFIILAGYIELARVFINSGFIIRKFFMLSFIIYSIISAGFYLFGLLKIAILLYTFLVLSVFDAFSQIFGQLFGKRKLLPFISPNKTIEGLIGGTITALISSVLLAKLLNVGFKVAVFTGMLIILSAFAGDIFASFYKRKYGVKDFSNALPGQGGILDRFDSLIFSGSYMYLISITT